MSEPKIPTFIGGGKLEFLKVKFTDIEDMKKRIMSISYEKRERKNRWSYFSLVNQKNIEDVMGVDLITRRCKGWVVLDCATC